MVQRTLKFTRPNNVDAQISMCYSAFSYISVFLCGKAMVSVMLHFLSHYVLPIFSPPFCSFKTLIAYFSRSNGEFIFACRLSCIVFSCFNNTNVICLYQTIRIFEDMCLCSGGILTEQKKIFVYCHCTLTDHSVGVCRW